MFKKKRFWCIIITFVLAIGGAAVWWWYAFHAGGGPPIFTISKETSYVTGPVLPSGHIDYVTALNERLSEGVTPENNAQVLLMKAMGPRPENSWLSATYYKWLGMEEPPEKGDYFVQLHESLKKTLKVEPDSDTKELVDLDLKKRKLTDEIWKSLDELSHQPWKKEDHPHAATCG